MNLIPEYNSFTNSFLVISNLIILIRSFLLIIKYYHGILSYLTFFSLCFRYRGITVSR